MAFPLKPVVGQQLFLVPGASNTHRDGRAAIVTEISRLYVTVSGCARFRISDGFNQQGATFGRLWQSADAYLAEHRRTTELVRLRRAIDRMVAGSAQRPSLEQTHAAAAALGITLETAQ